MAKPQIITTTNYEYLRNFMGNSKGSDWVNNIPQLTKDNIASVGNAIMDLQASKDAFYNQFILKIKEQIFKGMTANNKFKFLKGKNVSGIIEDSYVDYIKGKNFDPEDTTLLKNVKATIKTLYHKIDRRLVYETSISDAQLREAMLGEYGLDTLLGNILNTLYESAEWDEFTMFKEMIVYNLQHAGKVVYLGKPLVDGTTDIDWKTVGDALLYNLKKYSKNLTYLSRDYNKLGLASRTSRENQILVMQKDIANDIDFTTLANIFNLDKLATEMTNMVEVDNFNENEDILACIMSKDGFRYHDYLRTTETFRNGQTLTTKYMHHVQQMISYSYLYNTIYFVLGDEPEGTE